MFYVLFVATVLVALSAADEPKPEESALPIQVYDLEPRYRDGLELMRHREHEDHRPYLHIHENRHKVDPQKTYIEIAKIEDQDILRGNPHRSHPHEHIDIEKQNRIISHTFSPDFIQPSWILDYRYIKSGGRDYTRGPGGQILILPHGVQSHEKNEFSDFDSLLEHLRLSRIAEEQARIRANEEHRRINAEHGVHEDHKHRPYGNHIERHRPLGDHLERHRTHGDHLERHRPREDHLERHRPREDHLERHRPREEHLERHRPLGDHIERHRPHGDHVELFRARGHEEHNRHKIHPVPLPLHNPHEMHRNVHHEHH